MWLICGLGNLDNKYKFTKHNLGFDIVDSLIKSNFFDQFKKDKFKEIYKGKINGKECLICKPLTYMNLSGPPIAEIVNFYKISLTNLIIIHDDLDIAIGKIKIKVGGGNGGHNGLLSIDNVLGENYKRLRIGIGHPGSRDFVSKYVLEKFSIEDREIINNKIELINKYFSLIFENDGLFLTKVASKE